MSGSSTAQINHNEKKAFLVKSSSLKDVRTFCREVFEKLDIEQSLKDELVLAIAEAAQNIVKHAYNGRDTSDLMRIEFVYENNILTVNLLDKGDPAIPANIKPRKLDDIKAGGLGTFFIGQIMDEVIFKTSATDWVNHLILKKNY